MKKKYLTLLTIPLMLGMLTGCFMDDNLDDIDPDVTDPETNPNENGPFATIEVKTDENIISFESTLDVKKKHHEDDKGSLTFVTKPNFYIKRVKQNGIVDVHRDPDNKFKFNFTLLEGKNEFVVTTFYKENIFNSNGLLEHKDNEVDINGTLTDEVDDKPTPGGFPQAPLPSYKNTGTIYFLDSSWWQGMGVSTSIVCYDKTKKVINSDTDLGVSMRHMQYLPKYKQNWWKWAVDKDTTSYVQFIRTGDGGASDWNARTDLLPVPDFKTNDAYILSDEAQWYKDNMGQGPVLGYAKASIAKKSTYQPKPVEGHGIYKIYLDPNGQWSKLSEAGYGINIHMFGLEETTWPGVAMKKEGKYYTYDIPTEKYQNMVFALTKDGKAVGGNENQTSDLSLDFKTFGDDAKLLATLGNKGSDGKVTCNFTKFVA